MGTAIKTGIESKKMNATTSKSTHLARYDEFVSYGNNGLPGDVDQLMAALITQDDLATSRLVDYALSLVSTREGIQQVRRYLFQGIQIQRNYAALFFKRKGWTDLLDEAIAQGKIDFEQAYAK